MYLTANKPHAQPLRAVVASDQQLSVAYRYAGTVADALSDVAGVLAEVLVELIQLPMAASSDREMRAFDMCLRKTEVGLDADRF